MVRLSLAPSSNQTLWSEHTVSLFLLLGAGSLGFWTSRETPQLLNLEVHTQVNCLTLEKTPRLLNLDGNKRCNVCKSMPPKFRCTNCLCVPLWSLVREMGVVWHTSALTASVILMSMNSVFLREGRMREYENCSIYYATKCTGQKYVKRKKIFQDVCGCIYSCRVFFFLLLLFFLNSQTTAYSCLSCKYYALYGKLIGNWKDLVIGDTYEITWMNTSLFRRWSYFWEKHLFVVWDCHNTALFTYVLLYGTSMQFIALDFTSFLPRDCLDFMYCCEWCI